VGGRDIDRLYAVYQRTIEAERALNLGFSFKWDLGTFETAIIIEESGTWRKPAPSENWEFIKPNEALFCPDLIDYASKAIIEFEEMPTPRKKGHTEESARDTRRDSAYHSAGFDVLKIWEDTEKGDYLSLIKSYFLQIREKRPRDQLDQNKQKVSF